LQGEALENSNCGIYLGQFSMSWLFFIR